MTFLSLSISVLLGLALFSGCNDEGTCVVFLGSDKPISCIDVTDQVSTGDAKSSCTSGGGTWQESACSTVEAIGECADRAGSVVVYYQEYLVALSITEAELIESCQESGSTYSEL